MEQKKLKTLFESIRPELEAKLSSMTFTKGSVKIQETIVEYLNRLLDENGEYRQNLTMSEDYVLQAAISLLNAQQAMVLQIASHIQFIHKNKQPNPQPVAQGQNKVKGLKREQYPIALGGTALGGITGAIALGTWGAVIGAIAGTAVALYYVGTSQQTPKTKPVQNVISTQGSNNKVDALMLLDIVGTICENVDTLIDTFRVQIERIKDSFASKKEQSFLADYNAIANNMEQLFIIADSDDDEDKLNDFTMQIGLLRRSLSNYGMEFKDGKIIKK